MSQGGIIAGALLLAWIMYLAIKGRLTNYLAVFTGTAGGVAAPADGSNAPAAGSVGADPNFQPSVLKPGSTFEQLFGTPRAPLNPPT